MCVRVIKTQSHRERERERDRTYARGHFFAPFCVFLDIYVIAEICTLYNICIYDDRNASAALVRLLLRERIHCNIFMMIMTIDNDDDDALTIIKILSYVSCKMYSKMYMGYLINEQDNSHKSQTKMAKVFKFFVP